MGRTARSRLAAALAAVGATVVVFGAGDPAQATAPARPTGLHVVGATASSITIGANRAAGATHYRLFASRDRSDVYVPNIDRALHSPLSTTPTMTIGGLRFTTKPYYYRVEALNATSRSFSAVIGVAGLRPAVPTNLQAVSTAGGGTHLTWDSGGATGFDVVQATDPTMSAGRQVYRVRDFSHQFTPLGLTRGSTYYFRVRAVNNGTRSAVSARTDTVAQSRSQPVRVLSYNILHAIPGEVLAGGQTIPPWSWRRPGVVALIKKDAPDIVALQEGWPWIGEPQGYGGTRQVDTVVAALPGYALARTEVPPTEHGYRRCGNYILYRPASYSPVGTGWHWTIDYELFASYQEFENRSTGARFLFVSAHLVPGAGATLDEQRQAETRSLVQQASALAATDGVPVVYAGDFNSDLRKTRTLDGAGVVMHSVLADDAQQVAPSRSNARYDSYNQYARRPPTYGLDIDRIFAAPGVGVRSWGVVLDLTDGAFVGTIPSDHNPVRATVLVPY